MRKVILAGVFLMIVASDWAWTKNAASTSDSFVPQSFSAKFVQEYKSFLGKRKRVKKSDATVDYKYPSNIRFEMKGKSEVIFVSNPKQTWYFTPSQKKGQPANLKVGKSSDNNLAHFFDILKNGLNSNEDYKVKKIDEAYEITFSKKTAKKIDVLKAKLIFKEKKNRFQDIKQIDLVRKKNKKVSMKFSKIEVDKSFATKHFHFIPPTENVRISN